MKITDVKIENFLTVGDEVSLNLDNRGLMLITGDNRDDSSAVSNGAGKSTLADSLFWCLYGVTARGESGDSVVNNTVGKNCRVGVMIEDGGAVYSVVRYRKHKVHKNTLQIENVISGQPLTKGTDKLTQDLVNKLLGCSIEVFRSAIYSGQDSIPNLPEMTDKNLKEIVEEAAGISRLGEAYLYAREELKSKADSLLALTLELASVERHIDDAAEDYADLMKRESSFAEEKDGKLKALSSDRDSVKVLLVDKESKVLLIGETELTNKLVFLDAEVFDFLRDKKSADDHERATSRSLALSESVLRDAVKRVNDNYAKVGSIDERVGKPCDECGKAYCKEDLESASAIAARSLTESKKIARALKTSWDDAKNEQNNALTACNLIGDTSAALSAIKTTADDVRGRLAELATLKGVCKSIEGRISIFDAKIDELIGLKSPYSEMIESLKLRLETLNSRKALASSGVLNGERQVDLAEKAVKVFSPAGVRAHVLDTVTPQLNDRTSHYLSVLSDGNISAVWNTLSKTKAGELREKFTIEVSNDKGASSFGGMSGGEKRKVRIATALALQDLVASRASKPFELFIGDELDDALDEGGLERLMILLEEKAREKGTVLIISHNSLADWCNQVITVVKENGFSTIQEGL